MRSSKSTSSVLSGSKTTMLIGLPRSNGDPRCSVSALAVTVQLSPASVRLTLPHFPWCLAIGLPERPHEGGKTGIAAGKPDFAHRHGRMLKQIPRPLHPHLSIEIG